MFCSGTAGIDPATGVAPDGIEEQTEQALRNLGAVLAAAGASIADLVKTTIFYADVEDFAAINDRVRPVHAGPAAGPLGAGERQAAAEPADLDRGHRRPAEVGLPEQVLPEQVLPEQVLPEQVLPEQVLPKWVCRSGCGRSGCGRSRSCPGRRCLSPGRCGCAARGPRIL